MVVSVVVVSGTIDTTLSDSEVAQSCPTLCDPMDCSLPGSSAHGIFQAIVLEWSAISDSKYVQGKINYMIMNVYQ